MRFGVFHDGVADLRGDLVEVQPDIAAYQAAGERAQQSTPGRNASAIHMEGQSNPPADTYETTQYTGGVDVTGNSSYQGGTTINGGALLVKKACARATPGSSRHASRSSRESMIDNSLVKRSVRWPSGPPSRSSRTAS